MPHESWRDAVAEIRQATSTVTEKQRELAKIAGIQLPHTLPVLVAGARLQSALRAELGLPESTPSVDYQHEYIEELRSGDQPDPMLLDRREADAWIQFYRLQARGRDLERLELEAGDVVQVKRSDGEVLGEVSSIGSGGRIHFKGGMGAGAWPDNVTVRSRKGETGDAALVLRQVVANQIAARSRTENWSLAKQADLEDFVVAIRLTRDDVDELEQTIEAAEDEKPIQQLIEARPQLLASLLGGNLRFCLPRRRFGAERIPDFLISDVDSMGVRWVLVELETPASNVTLQDENQLDKYARKGVSQVEEWREWLQDNLDYARRSKRKNGLGLSDIRPGSEGLVLVGRRKRLHPNSEAVRLQIRERKDIRVQTYDWLLQQLEGVLTFSGPPAANPFVIPSQR